MKKHSALMPALMPALILALVAGTVQAQMSGSYTLDGSQPTSTTNFKTFEDATKQLFIQGISGPVTIYIRSATYNEGIVILPVKGASKTTPVTFRSLIPLPGSVKLTANSHILAFLPGLPGFPNFTVTGFVLDNLDFFSTQTNGYAIWGNPGDTDITIQNCTVHPGVLGYGSSPSFPSSSPRVIFIDGQNTALGWVIENNVFNFVKGATYGIYGSQIGNFRIHRNTFNFDQTTYGIYLINLNNARNAIFSNLFLGTLHPTSTGSAAVHVALSNLTNVIAGNTFDLNITPASYALRTFGTSSSYNRIFSNIFNITGAGGAIWVQNSTSLEWFNSDYNLFNVQSGIIGNFRGTNYSSLSSWQSGTGAGPSGSQDVNSIVGDPKFISATNRKLQSTSPAIGVGLVTHPTDPAQFKLETDFTGLIRGSKVDIGAYELLGFEVFGSGCAGTGGNVPVLGFTGDLAASSNFSVDLSSAKPSSPALVAIGVTKSTLPFGGGCDLLITPLVVVGVQTSATGTASLPAQTPNTLPAVGTNVHVQFGVTDSSAAGIGVAMSNGGSVKF
jgi:hypothetical protein